MNITKIVEGIQSEMLKKQDEEIKIIIKERLGYLPSLSELKDRLSVINIVGKEEVIQLDGKDLVSFSSIESKLDDSGESISLEFGRKVKIF
jgi:hypothetical protein